jgi:hypothetical protein
MFVSAILALMDCTGSGTSRAVTPSQQQNIFSVSKFCGTDRKVTLEREILHPLRSRKDLSGVGSSDHSSTTAHPSSTTSNRAVAFKHAK